MTRPDITLPRATVEQVVSELIAGTGSIDHINNLLTELTDALQAQPTPVDQPETTDVTFGATLFAFVRMSLAYPTEAQLHQLDRLIAFYGDQKFASQLKLLAHQARTPHVNRDVGRARSLVFSGSEGIGRKESEIQAAPHNHEDLKQLAEGALREHDGTDEGFHNWRAANRAFRRKTHPASILSLLSELNTRQAALQAQPTSKPAIAWPEPKCLTCGCHSIDIAGNCDYCGAPYKAQPTPPVGQAAAEPANEWKEAVIEQLAAHSMDAPVSDSPTVILAKIIHMAVLQATDPAISKRPAAQPASAEDMKVYKSIADGYHASLNKDATQAALTAALNTLRVLVRGVQADSPHKMTLQDVATIGKAAIAQIEALKGPTS